MLEKDHVGKGASGRSSAAGQDALQFPPEVQLELFQNWKEIVGEPGEFRSTGFVRLVPNNELSYLRANVATQKTAEQMSRY